MHAGRSYPYLPDYWATEAWFWPGFVPWKLRGSIAVAGPPLWNLLLVPWDAVSMPGMTVPDRTQVIYQFPLASMPGVTDLFVSMEMIATGGKDYGRWKAVLQNGSIQLAFAWLYQPKPQRTVNTLPDVFNTANVVPPTVPQLQLVCRPATYAEGGSPWPNY
jgi:hypothetical protein